MSEQLTQQHIATFGAGAQLLAPKDQNFRICINKDDLENLGFDLTGVEFNTKDHRLD